MVAVAGTGENDEIGVTIFDNTTGVTCATGRESGAKKLNQHTLENLKNCQIYRILLRKKTARNEENTEKFH